MNDEPEGGYPARETGVFVVSAAASAAADEAYYKSKAQFKRGFEAYVVDWTPYHLRSFVRNSYENWITHTKHLSGRNIAALFRQISKEMQKKSDGEPTPIERECNNRLWTHNQDGTLNHITSDDLVPLFEPGKENEWPNLMLTSNHARAGKSKDLSELMKGIEKIAGDAWHAPLDLYRFTREDRERESSKPNVKDKTILVLACHTERDIFLNGAELLDRRCDLIEDIAGNEDPKKRTLKHMSPASMRLAKLIMKSIVEPDPKGVRLVDLDRAKREYMHAPFIANDHNKTLVLRTDRDAIAQHFKEFGFSKSDNTVTDVGRFLWLEYHALGQRLKVRGANGKLRFATDEDIQTIISNIGHLAVAPGEVPLTEKEKSELGMNRSTIHNKNDLTAGHLVNPNKRDYDRWSDRLVIIDGAREDFGHSVVRTLGTTGAIDAGGNMIEEPQTGFIMDPANAHKPNYQTAQDEARAFFASNHQINAITTVCLSPEGAENAIYLQFAPGATRADVKRLEGKIKTAFQEHGFNGVSIESDLARRRRMRVVLDLDAGKRPIVTNDPKTFEIMTVDSKKIERCCAALANIRIGENNGLFVVHDVEEYLMDLQEKYPQAQIDAATAQFEKPEALEARRGGAKMISLGRKGRAA